MDEKEQDEILWRVDERTKRIDDHLENIDGRVQENGEDINEVQKDVQKNENDINTIKAAGGGIFTLLTAGLSGALAKLGGFF